MTDDQIEAEAGAGHSPAATGADWSKLRRGAGRRPAATGAAVDLSRLDRLPPHSIEAEQGVLGCILLSPNEVLALCAERLRHGAEAFYDPRHQTLYSRLAGMHERSEPITIQTLTQQLNDADELNLVGGFPYLSELQGAVGSTAELDYFLGILRERFRLRRLLKLSTHVIGRVHECKGDADALITEVERDILALNDDGDGASGVATKLGDELPKVVDTINNHRQGVKFKQGPFTGLNYLDNVMCGMGPGQYIVVSARPGCGKTSLAMQIAEHVAIEEKIPVGVFSMEMLKLELAMRQAFASARVSMRKFRNGFMDQTDAAKFTPVIQKLRHAEIWVDDSPGLTFSQLAAKARRLKAQRGIGLLVVDYLQLMSGDEASENRARELSKVSTGIKSLAKELKIPIIVLAQMNRNWEADPKRKPQLSDLKDSGQIEQDADVVMFNYDVHLGNDAEDPASPKMKWLQRPAWRATVPAEFLAFETWRKHLRRINVLVAKQRSGESGVDCEMVFVKEWTRFVDIGVGDKEAAAEAAAANEQPRRGRAEQVEMPD